MLSANKDFIEISQKRKYAKEEVGRPDTASATTNVTNNNLILSTADLMRMLSNAENSIDTEE
jgi:hypothetical protein